MRYFYLGIMSMVVLSACGTNTVDVDSADIELNENNDTTENSSEVSYQEPPANIVQENKYEIAIFVDEEEGFEGINAKFTYLGDKEELTVYHPTDTIFLFKLIDDENVFTNITTGEDNIGNTTFVPKEPKKTTLIPNQFPDNIEEGTYDIVATAHFTLEENYEDGESVYTNEMNVSTTIHIVND
ncbi:hypothetical protein ACFO4L_12245 [Bacillus daqingensis]|uniref:Intracellular proteinase inhibitor BsuPI domain-containing protein n=1 Tax=Bacillus daqingensis TaxID=872396 RepID=A0ABV9NVF3_9BACI